MIIKEVDYANYGKCLSISNGIMEVYVTIDLGPRIIKCNICGKENLMFNDLTRGISNDVSDAFGENKTWYIYGGHRMWVSPENLPLTYYPDNEKVAYKMTSNGAVFTPPVQKVNDLQHEIEIVMDCNEAKMDVIHRLTNIGCKNVTGAIWALSVMREDGVCVVPQPQNDTGLLSNRVFSIWAYTDMSDERVFWGEKYIAVKQTSNDRKFKFGINNIESWIAYINKDQALVKCYSPNHPDGNYPDYGVSTEVFTNEHFLEAETLSELCDIAPKETITHVETWKLVDNVQKPEFNNKSLEEISNKLT
ncbi:MAG: hypothetical protein FWF15_07305 [Oscillospiraceae bacterium]|nr:hypothetical protein [Oscillospiraceae bacterium]